ncbi:MAG: hypothetical protein RR719_07780 [Akkermansia sp.]
MNIYYSDIATSIQSTINGQSTQFVAGKKLCGQILMAQAELSTKNTMLAGDIIQLFRIPKGAVIIPHLSLLCSDFLVATTLVITLGDQSDPTRYSNELDIGKTGYHQLEGGTQALKALEIEESTWLTATIITATNVTENKKIMAWIAYTLP